MKCNFILISRWLYNYLLFALLHFVLLRTLFQYLFINRGFIFKVFTRGSAFILPTLTLIFIITVPCFDVQGAKSRSKKNVECTWSNSFIYAITLYLGISNRIRNERKAQIHVFVLFPLIVSVLCHKCLDIFAAFRLSSKVDYHWLHSFSSLNSHFSGQSYHSTFLRRWQWPQHRPHLAVPSMTFKLAFGEGANKQRRQERTSCKKWTLFWKGFCGD